MSETPENIHFQPFTVLLGIILGTIFSIAFGLAVVTLVFWILLDEDPRIAAEFGSLLVSTGIFACLSVFAGLSFYGSLKQIAWRHWIMVCLWVGLLLAGRYYWP
jgi:hypothetical protein